MTLARVREGMLPWVFITLVISAILIWSGTVAFLTLLGKVVAKLLCVFGLT